MSLNPISLLQLEIGAIEQYRRELLKSGKLSGKEHDRLNEGIIGVVRKAVTAKAA